MKKSVFLIIHLVGLCFSLAGQQQNQLMRGMNYQAVAFDGTGEPLMNVPIDIAIAFTSKGEAGHTYYTETHQVTTDEQGLFNVVIGEGAVSSGQLSNIPWAAKKIWLDVEFGVKGSQSFSHSTELHAVPYAFHAATTSKLDSEDKPVEKNQSIRWTTSGNTATKPEIHFLGTRDDKDLVFKSNQQNNAIVTNRGQVKIIGRKSGIDNDPTNYPLLVEGGNQGIHIKVKGSRNNTNNFVQFGDDFDTWGAIQGQTFPELEATWGYKLRIADYAGRAAILVARSVITYNQAAYLYSAGSGASASLIFAFAAPGFYGAATATIADAVAISLQAAKLLEQSITWGIKIREEIGVEYASGAADYAEWLKREENERDLQYGEIIGIRGGIVSLNTTGANHVMVVSRCPIVLGNAPQPGQEQSYEKVAFLGQVPVRVAGKVEVGDYILASGNNDGIGIALHPSQLSPSDYRRIVGIAWDAAEDRPLNLVKIGIGLNKNDLAPKVEAINQKADEVIAYLQGKGSLPGKSAGLSELTNPASPLPNTLAFAPVFDPAAMDQLLDDSAEQLRDFYQNLETQLKQEGVAIPDIPEIQALFKDPIQSIKKLRRDPLLEHKWKELDQQLKSFQNKH